MKIRIDITNSSCAIKQIGFQFTNYGICRTTTLELALHKAKQVVNNMKHKKLTLIAKTIIANACFL